MDFDLLGRTAATAGRERGTRSVFDPATGEVAREFHVADEHSVDAAVGRAHQAWQEHWRHTTAARRAAVLRRIADRVRAHADEIAALEAVEVGKPLTQARQFDLELCVASFEYYAGLLAHPPGQVRFDGPLTSVTELDPYGVVAGILPFNWPPIHLAAKCAPALAAGNAVVLKPPEQAPSAVIRLVELISLELPDGLVQAVCGGATVGEALVTHEKVGKISFTGSVPAGRAVSALAARRLTPTLMELGGKNALVVLAGADLGAAVRGAVEGAWFNQGEACTAASRLLVHESLHDEFVARLSAAVRRLVVGPPLEARTHVGPLVSRQQQTSVLGHLETAVAEGAEVAAEAPLHLPDRYADGFWVRPTLLTRVDPGSRAGQEEIFGPVATVTPFATAEEAVAIANGTPFALVAGVYDRDTAAAWAVARRLDAGIVFVNNYNRSVLGTPFGGNRHSGHGREHSPETLRAYGRSKSYRLPNGSGEVPQWFAVNEVT
ncbi:aldehyde dehydrogenase family protein [Streptomyces sp. DSM 44917]|uniref:Aldehyde dehydrogenase family protein n=1 Tax=Streptomyces boetiae TaxID=3075541 RepID=A0ABU2L7L6_9ACTN|nr:aldehyde dehydrogenase family protein [Streptomyces sp. DSM 44917]MDT0307327.1 aldehyde dehydrogenase family protein [Streptomyces sp. DSM 44917]